MKIPFKVDLTGKTAIVTGGTEHYAQLWHMGLPLVEQKLP